MTRFILPPVFLLFLSCRDTASPDAFIFQGAGYSGFLQVVNIHGIQQDTFTSQVVLNLAEQHFHVMLPDGMTAGCAGLILQDSAALRKAQGFSSLAPFLCWQARKSC